jgi:3-oxoadipate enol-lactonase
MKIFTRNTTLKSSLLAAITGLSACSATPLETASMTANVNFGEPTMITTQTGNLAVYQVGQGAKTIVFWPSLFTDHRMYLQQAIALKDDYRLVLIDGPGHGQSGAQIEGATLSTHAESALQVMNQLHITQASFVGTSWGGLVGAHLAHTNGARISALVALNTPFDTKPNGPEFGDKFVVWGARLVGSTGVFADGVADAFFSPHTISSQPQLIKQFKASFAEYKHAALSAVARTVLLERQTTLPWLATISVPTIVVSGHDDKNYSPAASRYAASLIAGAQFVELPNSGHMSAIETPDAVSQLIRQASAL